MKWLRRDPVLPLVPFVVAHAPCMINIASCSALAAPAPQPPTMAGPLTSTLSPFLLHSFARSLTTLGIVPPLSLSSFRRLAAADRRFGASSFGPLSSLTLLREACPKGRMLVTTPTRPLHVSCTVIRFSQNTPALHSE